MTDQPIALGVNIDHVATLRQARRGDDPDPVRAAHEAELGGADCITVHLREDRRHIQDHDLERLRPFVHAKLNLEMAATDEMVAIALRTRPHMVTLVPEGRAEVTTEGGLAVSREGERMTEVNKQLHDAGIAVSAFIDADVREVGAAKRAGFDACEIHTGPYAAAFRSAGGDIRMEELGAELERIARAGAEARNSGMRFNAGHALNYLNVGLIAALPGVWELHIGHAIVSRAVYVGLREAVAEMKRLMVEHSARTGRSR